MESLGRHILVDIFDAPADLLNDERFLVDLFEGVARKTGAAVLNVYSHHFEPYGVSCAVIIAESHFSIHTWPEHAYAALDFFSCGTRVDLDMAVREVLTALKAKHSQITEVKRGVLSYDQRMGFSSDFRFV